VAYFWALSWHVLVGFGEIQEEPVMLAGLLTEIRIPDLANTRECHTTYRDVLYMDFGYECTD
jgi:hypothetical protein